MTVASAEGGACFQIAEMTVAVAFVASPTDSLNHYPHHRFEVFLAREEVVCEASADAATKETSRTIGLEGVLQAPKFSSHKIKPFITKS